MTQSIASGLARAVTLATAVLLNSMAAQAAEMPVKAPPLVHSWGGFYVGGNVGYSWGPWDTSGILASPTGAHSPKVDGWLVGMQAGYNWQNGQWVFGIEGDYQWSFEKDTFNWVFPFTIGDARSGLNISNEWSFPWFATLRGRVGWTPSQQWLIYGTGGLAYGKADFTVGVALGAATASVSESATRVGWTAGGGVEYAFARNWSAKAEYLYLDLGTHKFFSGASATDVKLNDHIARLGLNYRFIGPVMTRY